MIQRKYLILMTIAGFIVILDQMTKMYIHTHFFLGESTEVIKNFFNLTYVRNTGAAFGIFRDSHKIFKVLFFFSIPPIALFIITRIVRNLTEKDSLQILALASIFGGAIGNYIDRIRFGYVIDFLDFHIKGHSWPAFNVADITIVCGIVLLFFITLTYALKYEKMKKK